MIFSIQLGIIIMVLNMVTICTIYGYYIVLNHWLVVTGTMELYDFPFSWECHHPN